MRKPRKGSRADSIEVLRALSAGGIGALKAAEELLDERTTIQVRTTAARKRLYQAAAKDTGGDLSKLVIRLLDEYLARKR